LLLPLHEQLRERISPHTSRSLLRSPDAHEDVAAEVMVEEAVGQTNMDAVVADMEAGVALMEVMVEPELEAENLVRGVGGSRGCRNGYGTRASRSNAGGADPRC
jgi:hypothetical protein